MTNETNFKTPIINLDLEVQTTNETNSTIESTPNDTDFDWNYFTPFATNGNANTVTPVSLFQPATNLSDDFEQEVHFNSVNNLNNAFEEEASKDPNVQR
jgi:hypothetical protein